MAEFSSRENCYEANYEIAGSKVMFQELHMKKLRIGIIGAGRMGGIRGRSARRHPGCEVLEVADTNLSRAQLLAAELGCAASADCAGLITREDIDAVVVATPHKFLAPISAAALRAGKHALCEKPGARTSAEAETMLRVLYGSWPPAEGEMLPPARRAGAAQLVVGFTLRHHPAIVRARELLTKGEIGRPMYLVGRYGHGGRPGYEQEWRAMRDLAGGGELLDQGIHLIDVSRWFLGEFEEVAGFVGTYFWRPRQAAGNNTLEDNAFLLLRSAAGHVASLQASWTQWKNLFAFEVHGENGFLQVQGLGGSYGKEQLTVGYRNTQGGPPETKEIDLRAGGTTESENDVWAVEWQAFVSAVSGPNLIADRAPMIQPASAIDAWQALRIVEAAYEASRTGAGTPLREQSVGVSKRSLTTA
jgi:predicted dehydrogenase